MKPLTHFLVIKGTFLDAVEKCKQLDIPFYMEAQTSNEVRGCTRAEGAKILAWYSMSGQAPFSPGDLLFFTTRSGSLSHDA